MIRATLASLVIATLVVATLWPTTSDDAARTVRSVAESTAPSFDSIVESHEIPGAADSELHGYRPGDRLQYRLDQTRVVDVTMQSVFNPVDGAAQPAVHESHSSYSSSTTGRLVIAVYTADRDRGLFGFSIESAQVTALTNDMSGAADRNAIGRELAREVLVRVGARGQVESIAFPEAIPAEAELLWRDLLARWQIVYPESAGDNTWETEEDDATGRCLVAYQRDSETIVKSRIEYLKHHHLSTSRGLGGQNAIPVGDIVEDITYRVRRIPLNAQSHGTGHIDLQDDTHTIDAAIDFSLALTDQRHETSLIAGAADAQERFDAATVSTLGLARAVRSGRPAVEPTTNESIESLLDELRALIEKHGVSNPAVVAAMARLTQMIRESDHAVDLAVSELYGALPKGMAAVLFGAFGAAGTPAAQLALRNIFTDDSWTDGGRFTALAAFAQVENPLPAVDEELEALYARGDALGRSALLILGVVSNKVVHSDATRSAAITRQMVERLTDPTASDQTRLVAVRALGNAAPTSTPQALVDLVAHGNERIRRAAVEAVERTLDEGATDLLLDAAHSDASEETRRHAIRLLATEGRPGAGAALTEIALGSDPEAVRHAALHYLGLRAGDDASSREAVEWIATGDTSATLRGMASQILATLDR